MSGCREFQRVVAEGSQLHVDRWADASGMAEDEPEWAARGAHVELGVIYRAVELYGRFLEHIANRREVGIDQ